VIHAKSRLALSRLGGLVHGGCLILQCGFHGLAVALPEFGRVVVDANPPTNPWTKLVGDFNQDGRLDIAIAGSHGPLVWYANPDWTKREVAKGGWQTVSGAVADLDGDGDPDLVPGAQDWFENPLPVGDPAKDPWPPHRISEIRSHDALVADLDKDGRPDVVARDQSGFNHRTGNQVHFFRQAAPDRWEHQAIECPHLHNAMDLGRCEGGGRRSERRRASGCRAGAGGIPGPDLPPGLV
jgi:hypothetical protein